MNNKQRKLILSLLLLASVTFYVLGLYYPLFGSKQQLFGLVLKYEDVRLFDSVEFFYKQKAYFLAGIILFTTIVFPVVKFLDIFNKIFVIFTSRKKISKILVFLDKWSMLDVFIVALIIMVFKINSNFVGMKVKQGTNFLALAVFIRMMLSFYLNKLKKKHYTL